MFYDIALKTKPCLSRVGICKTLCARKGREA